jgi:predicted transcriptional regulator
MLGGGTVKQLYELHGSGQSIRSIARELQISRNSVRKYLRSPGVPKAKPRPERVSKLDPYKEHLQERLALGIDNCVVLLRELRNLGYTGSYTILKEYIHPWRRQHMPQATVRFETQPGEQAQVDWGRLAYLTEEGHQRQLWVFVLVLGWSRAIYLECTRRADVATFIRCHLRPLWRRDPALPLRQSQGGSPGTGRQPATHLEPQIPGLCVAGWLRDTLVPALSGPDQRQGGKRHQVGEGELLAWGSF